MDNVEVITAAEHKQRSREELRAKIVEKVCYKIANGAVLADVLSINRPREFPNVSQWYKWMKMDPQIAAKYNEAVQVRLQNFVDSTFKEAENNTRDVKRSALIITNIQWYAEKIGRRVFGPSLAVGGADDLPAVKTISANVPPEEAYRLMLNGGVIESKAATPTEKIIEDDGWDPDNPQSTDDEDDDVESFV
jgi:hypothetical protein